MVNYVHGTTEEQRRQIVEEFCSVCDHYPDSCRFNEEKIGLYGEKIPSDQERYAMRNFCGWATVNGKWSNVLEEVVEFKNGPTVKRSDLGKKIEVELLETPKLPAPNASKTFEHLVNLEQNIPGEHDSWEGHNIDPRQ